MTLSPEERAKAVLDAMQAQIGICACIGPQAGADACPCALKRRAIIATAIRQACNEKLEQAKTIAQNEADFASRNQRPGSGPSDGQIAATAIVLEIERLQSDFSIKDTST
jgi:hypothetical protein